MTEDEFDIILSAVLRESAEEEFKEFEENEEDFQYEPSDRFKRKMNRLFRERVGGSYLPHPEVDTVWERIRSSFVRRYLIIQDRVNKLLTTR